jgi:predicted secreted protein with PEFG-CTERM motif
MRKRVLLLIVLIVSLFLTAGLARKVEAAGEAPKSLTYNGVFSFSTTDTYTWDEEYATFTETRSCTTTISFNGLTLVSSADVLTGDVQASFSFTGDWSLSEQPKWPYDVFINPSSGHVSGEGSAKVSGLYRNGGVAFSYELVNGGDFSAHDVAVTVTDNSQQPPCVNTVSHSLPSPLTDEYSIWSYLTYEISNNYFMNSPWSSRAPQQPQTITFSGTILPADWSDFEFKLNPGEKLDYSGQLALVYIPPLYLTFNIYKAGKMGDAAGILRMYSGGTLVGSWRAGSGDNNPADQNIADVGPIPSGIWAVNKENIMSSGCSGYPLDPITYKGTRNGLWIHPWGTVFQGCIALGPGQFSSFEAAMTRYNPPGSIALLSVSYFYYWYLKVARVTAYSPVNLLVTSSDGSRVGYDWTTNTTVNEIDGATYTGPGTEPQVITIPSLFPDTYTISTYGTGTGSYTITVDSIAENDSITGTTTWTGTTSLGKLNENTVQINEGGSIVVPEFPSTAVLLLMLAVLCVAIISRKKPLHQRKQSATASFEIRSAFSPSVSVSLCNESYAQKQAQKRET